MLAGVIGCAIIGGEIGVVGIIGAFVFTMIIAMINSMDNKHEQ